MSSTVDIASSFIEGTPPGELSDVVNDVKALTSDKDPTLVSKLKPAFKRYNEEQLTAVKLPGSSQPVGSEYLPCLCCADDPRYLSANTIYSRMGDTTMLRTTQVSSSIT
jgi:F-actin capping protein alpha subunit